MTNKTFKPEYLLIAFGLASMGITFVNAYCDASRASLLTGIRPSSRRFIDFNTWVEKGTPDAVNLAQQFLRNGYHTIRGNRRTKALVEFVDVFPSLCELAEHIARPEFCCSYEKS